MELKRAVIMGATGAIGMALTEYLLEKQWEVILLVRSSSSKIQSLKEYEEEKNEEKRERRRDRGREETMSRK